MASRRAGPPSVKLLAQRQPVDTGRRAMAARGGAVSALEQALDGAAANALLDYQGTPDFSRFAGSYLAREIDAFAMIPLARVEELARELLDCWREGRQVFLIGNGGSAANAVHFANDFIYGISKKLGSGLRVNALSANASVLTCLGNDVGYDAIFEYQLAVLARPGDVVIALSGSGNSENIVRALWHARSHQLRTYGILGFNGGRALNLVDCPIHTPVSDMQISEDLQLLIGHLLLQWLSQQS